MLELTGVHAVYGRSHVLHGVSLRAGEGEVVSLLGRNGAGKSTTLKAIVGVVEVTAGEIRFEGRSLRGVPTHRVARLGIGLVPEDRRIFADLTVTENLLVGARPDGPWTVERVVALFPKLAELGDRHALGLDLQQRQVHPLVQADQPGVEAPPVAESYLDALGVAHDVGIGHQVAVFTDDEARSGAASLVWRPRLAGLLLLAFRLRLGRPPHAHLHQGRLQALRQAMHEIVQPRDVRRHAGSLALLP